jgi:hypothetical protein
MYESYLKSTSGLIMLLLSIATLESGALVFDEHLMKRGIDSKSVLIIEAFIAFLIVLIPFLFSKEMRIRFLMDYRRVRMEEMFVFVAIAFIAVILAYFANTALQFQSASKFRTIEIMTGLLVSGLLFFVSGKEVYTAKKLGYFICMAFFAVMFTISK